MLDILVNQLKNIKGIKAIVLGGSRSRNEHSATSDYDIGVYYQKENLDIKSFSSTLKALDDSSRDNLLNPPGTWGKWINGGAWLQINNINIDILLREDSFTYQTLSDCKNGQISIDYQCGHPFGFLNTIYAAEIFHCQILWQDKNYFVNNMKTYLASEGEYPPLMKKAIIEKFLWEAKFAFDCSYKPGAFEDINFIFGSVFQIVSSWLQVLYALNDKYLMNEKKALPYVSHLKLLPDELQQRIDQIYKIIADRQLEKAYKKVIELHNEISELCTNSL